jgi:hypothetical protein
MSRLAEYMANFACCLATRSTSTSTSLSQAV